jgi:iron complex outermembrane receptor protein
VELEARPLRTRKDQFTTLLFRDALTIPPHREAIGNTSTKRHRLQVVLNPTPALRNFLIWSPRHVSSGVNIFPPFEYGPMEVLNYEAMEGAWPTINSIRNQRYYETFDDYQANFSEFDVSLPGLNNPTLRNAETESTIWGIEFSGQARLGAFSLDFGLAYLESELGSFSDVRDPFRFVDNVNNVTGIPPGDGIADDANGDGTPDDVVNLSGAEVPFAPSFTGNIGIAYDFAFGEFTLTPRVDFSHQDETQAALWQDPQVTLEARDPPAQVTPGPTGQMVR